MTQTVSDGQQEATVPQPMDRPWHAEINDDGAFEIFDASQTRIICSRERWLHRVEESAANARLIVTAVNCHDDLVTALKRALWLLAAICGTSGNYPDEREIIAQVRAALSKAGVS